MSVTQQKSNLVSVDWLKNHLKHPDLIILDATMKHKPNGDSIEAPFGYILGAQEFNFDTDICDQNTNLPHMLPPQKQFEESAINLRINNDSIIVIYDTMGIFSSPRAWWMFKVMGHQNVFVLDGGLPEWVKTGGPTQTNISTQHLQGNFRVSFNPQLIVHSKQITESLDQKHFQIIDARSHTRFNALEPKPREGLSGGHISGSFCLPFTELLKDGLFKSKQELSLAFELVINTTTEKLIFSCGSGVTSCVLALAADELGFINYSVYDGSWSEWGQQKELI